MLLGSILGGQDNRLTTAADLRENLVRGDASFVSFTRAADEYSARNGLDLPLGERTEFLPDPKEITDPILEVSTSDQPAFRLSFGRTGFVTILIGSTCRFLPPQGTDRARCPLHKRGITRVPGLYFWACPGSTNTNPRCCMASARTPGILPNILNVETLS